MKYAAMYVDFSDSCDDRRPQLLGVYNTRSEAISDVYADIQYFCEDFNIEVSDEMLNEMAVSKDFPDNKIECVWNIQEI